MHKSSFPPALTITASTMFIFSPAGIGISWEPSEVRLVQVNDRAEGEIIREIRFDKEEIIDVAVHDDELFILTGISEGTQWRRQLKRRQNLDDDEWTDDHPLRSQTGSTLWLSGHGVNAVLRAGKNMAIVKIIGPDCYVSMWRAPNGPSDASWHCFHEELTWDPDLIAKEIGLENADVELAAIQAAEANDEQDELEVHRRYQHQDVEFLDYAFLSDKLAVRIRDVGQDDGEVASEGTFQAIYPVTSLVPANSNGGEALECVSADAGGRQVDCITREYQDGFIAYTFTNLGPNFYGALALHPAFDIDPQSAVTDVPTMRFLRFTTPEIQVKSIDIPFTSLFEEDPCEAPEVPKDERSTLGNPYVISWDGRDTICVIYRDSVFVAADERKASRGWFMKLPHDILLELGVDTSS
ncbi:hypothetical protein B0H19DRAFT_1295240 [Mycena capillaripes]|nr:hypothetical protein B0H19DRAFT_1295240 [Mycena capillaripes]